MSVESSTEQGKEEGQKQKGYPESPDNVSAESSTKGGKEKTSLQGQKPRG